MKTAAIDIDDTLNDFTATLRDTDFPADPEHPLAEGVHRDYLEKLRSGAKVGGDLLTTEYSGFRLRIYEQCYRLAKARPDGVEFVRWLRAAGWRIVICSQRDLRHAGPASRTWLAENHIGFDHLFTAANAIRFCRDWGIRHLIDDEVGSIVQGPSHGVNVYYPVMAKHQSSPPNRARGFTDFEEIKQWIHE